MNMENPPATLAGGLIRRISHDLANPLAAVQMLADGTDPLLQQAITAVADQLAMHRAIFGGAPDDAIDMAALMQRVAGAIDPARLEHDIAPSADVRCIKAAAALALALGGAGRLRLSVSADGAIHVVAEKPRTTTADDPLLAFANWLAGPLILPPSGEQIREIRTAGA